MDRGRLLFVSCASRSPPLFFYNLRTLIASEFDIKQPLLFDDESLPAGTSVAVLGSKRALTKEQRQFNKLIADIESARQALAQWREFIGTAQRGHDAKMMPLLAKYRDLRIAMVKRLDAAASGGQLTKAERRKVVDLLEATLTGLLDETRSPELEQLYEKYCDASFDEDHEAGLDFMREMMRETMGVDVGDDARTPEDFARAMHGKLLEEEMADARQEQQKSNRKRSARALQREAAQAKAEQGATMSVREVYRKLVAELHPDREPDPAQRARKTDLMQEINRAYEAKDLLTLLTLQLRIEQINLTDLAGLARERLVHYNRVLSEQLKRLCEELAELTLPYEDFRSGLKLTPDDVRRGMNAEQAQMQQAIRSTEADLARFQDIAALKRSLKSYRVGDATAGPLDDIEALLMEGLSKAQRRRR